MSRKVIFSIFWVFVCLSAAIATENPRMGGPSDTGAVGESAAVRDPNEPADPNQPADGTKETGPEGASGNQANAGQKGTEPMFEPAFSAESPLPELYKASEKIFKVYVNEKGEVNYSRLRRKRGDMLDAINVLEKVSQEQLMPLSLQEKTAFWINAHNLCVLRLVIDNYPIQPKWYMIFYPDNSIMQISDPWTKHYFTIGGLEYNLQEIEKGLLLERFKDVRICFTLSSATVGGATLRNEPYYANRLDKQLDDQVRKYLANPQGCRLDKAKNILYLSNIFNVYKDEFLGSEYASVPKFRNRPDIERAWLNFLLEYLPAEDVKYIEKSEFSIQLLEYNWSLNETGK